MTKILLDNKADVNYSNLQNGMTAMMYAAGNGHANIVKSLLPEKRLEVDEHKIQHKLGKGKDGSGEPSTSVSPKLQQNKGVLHSFERLI